MRCGGWVFSFISSGHTVRLVKIISESEIVLGGFKDNVGNNGAMKLQDKERQTE